jgi:outer membrane protein assembly factor BamB
MRGITDLHAAFPRVAAKGSMNWPEFGFIPSGGRFNSRERTLSPRNAHRLKKRWSFATGCSGSICGGSSAAVVNGAVYAGAYDGNVYALNAATGAKLWSFNTGNLVLSSPAIANGVAYVGSENGSVYALKAATGTKLWSYATANQVASSPTVVDGTVYIVSQDGSAYAFGL